MSNILAVFLLVAWIIGFSVAVLAWSEPVAVACAPYAVLHGVALCLWFVSIGFSAFLLSVILSDSDRVGV